ncbi:cell division inhibitor SepF [Anoxybacillus voinovskiensis]|uniref:Cell division protein SepF n=1 Tax=Anoxybacteroides voinovskiense TaxID=230470 RepID=A0A840DQW4_9BACL|nr:cell division protein SepF [Anoxybacillus voinovskiensis]MBB4072567.1 cell division inhibitor SepF [Anoxybacillus voinovskiensis]GGJ55231.1 cell division protein SepF [Anoxybacillus voinovskiensis]
MGLIKKFKDYFLEDEYEEYEEEYVEEEEPQQPAKGTKQNVVSLQSVQKSSKVVLIEPRAYAEAQEIADHLKNRRAVVVNLQRIPHDQAKRIVDFLSGTVYAIGGDIQQVGTKIFLCTPDNVDVTGTISAISDDETTMKRW